MAYLLGEPQLDAGGTSNLRVAAFSPSALGPTEWRVVRLAGRDGRATLSAPGPLRRLGRALFGVEVRGGLADARLETLRRFVVLSRLGARRATAAGAELLALGFVPAELESIRRVAAPHSPRRPTDMVAPGIVAAVATVLTATFANYIDDPLPAAAAGIAAGLPVVTLAHGLTNVRT